ncbi:MAG: hypothetical protein ABIU54_06825 [Candidatus Eisenbacteria bacterium]
MLDSLPSRDALLVLGNIPEPLTGAQTLPPARPQSSALAPDSGRDSLRDTADPVPVPVSTRPLGVTPAPDPVTPPPPAAPIAAEPDTCWRIQVAAPLERAKAVSMQAAARSLLLVPMVIVQDAGRYKVRTEQCLPRGAADALRDRAVASGFSGVFLVREQRPQR